jgi:uncharacterized protein (DUF427 family)/predicted SnoaL-like aldol condensation-catalyzing enzyme
MEASVVADKQVKIPGPDHPITITPNPARIVVSVAGHIVADTRNALTLREADYPSVQYIPIKDVDISLLERTDYATYCPYKGECSYYSIAVGGERSVNAVWTYEAPFASVAQIKDHVAFYFDRVDAIAQRPLSTEEGLTGGKEAKNKALVLEAFDTLFNKRDYVAAERYWSPNYLQHSAHIEPGREGLFNLIKSIPDTLKYEPGVIVAEGDFVIVHGRFSGIGLPVNWIAADILHIVNGVLVEHWDVIQDEATQAASKSGRPMFGDLFPR